jgi:hypothetical protein
MRLTKKALVAINQQDTRLKLALALSCTEQWIIKIIKANKDNGPLTTASALMVIRQETKMKDDQILTKEMAPALAKG